MNDHQEIVVLGRNVFDAAAYRLDLEKLLHLLDDGPRFVLLDGIRIDGQKGHQADNLLLRIGEIEHQTREVVFEIPLALGIEEGDDLLIIGTVGSGEAEINLLASGIELDTLKAVGDRLVLLDGIGFGVDDLEVDPAFRQIGVVLQEFANASDEITIDRRRLGQGARRVKPERQRLVDGLENLPGAVGKCVEPLFRQIDYVSTSTSSRRRC